MSKPVLLLSFWIVCLVLGAAGLPAAAGQNERREGEAPIAVPAAAVSDPCLFFRGQAHARGLHDFETEMLMACEEIWRRRTAGHRLSDRVQATDAMLQTYRQAVVAAGTEALSTRLRANRAPWLLGLSDEERHAIAEATGALLVLDSIRNGF
jgi:hypothetical protein